MSLPEWMGTKKPIVRDGKVVQWGYRKPIWYVYRGPTGFLFCANYYPAIRKTDTVVSGPWWLPKAKRLAEEGQRDDIS